MTIRRKVHPLLVESKLAVLDAGRSLYIHRIPLPGGELASAIEILILALASVTTLRSRDMRLEAGLVVQTFATSC